MIIEKYELGTPRELEQIIKKTSLRGNPNAHPFERARIMMQFVKPKDMIPTKNFLFQEQFDAIDKIYTQMKRNSVDIFNLLGFVRYKLHGCDQQFIFTPPIIELIDNQPLIIDGQHRVAYAMENNLHLCVLAIENVPENMLPNQMPLVGGWDAVQRFETTMPDNFAHNPGRYNDDRSKNFYREYPFDGITKIARGHTGR
ncbi:hypothetical protein HDR61_04890 [bacterium]|nr:hypothetical protein [bacterium]